MKKFYFATALAAFALASCTSDDIGFNTAQDVIEAQQSNAIQFGTYMGKQATTRATVGQAGSMTTNVLQASTNGFGVFAYYTGATDYNYTTVTTDGTSGQSTTKANFMYNQQVKYDTQTTPVTYDQTQGYVSHWIYTPLKYWPNEVQNGAVDDQDNNANTNPATSSNAYGGKLSFFAYAPYVTYATANGATDSDDGIIGMTANTAASDPILTYKVASDGKNVVDLLWGTYGNTSHNVNDAGNAGVAYAAEGTPYQKSILSPYKLNADLTKQKTNGVVDFAFKHALAKVGGSTTGTVTNSGLRIVLDLDDQKGAENGGTKADATKVTVNSITINAKAKSAASGDDVYYQDAMKGNFNLANGRWQITSSQGTSASAATTTHTINTAGTGVAGKLNTVIAEPASVTQWSDLTQNGVTTTEVNVYQTEAAPLVFIPGTFPELTVTVDYFVRTQDSNLDGGYSNVEQIITKKITFTEAVELNKQYNLLIHLGLTSVKFTATVSDWQVDGMNEDNTTGTLNNKNIYVPINVAHVTP